MEPNRLVTELVALDASASVDGANTTCQVIHSSHGSRLQRASNSFALLYDVARQFPNTKPSFPEITFAFADRVVLNAFASLREHSYHVGMTLAAPLLLADYFHRVLANPDTFPEVGNPSAETRNTLLQRTSPFALTLDDSSIDLASPLSVQPKCPVRHRFSDVLAQSCVRFLLAHEIGHVWGGHLEYAHRRLSLTTLQEAVAFPFSVERALDYQSLECDADHFATAMSLHFLIFEDKATLHSPHNWTRVLGSDLESSLLNWMYAIASMWLLFKPLDHSLEDFTHSTHPHPIPRLLLTTQCCAHCLRGRLDFAELIWPKGGYFLGRAADYHRRVFDYKPEGTIWNADMAKRANLCISAVHARRLTLLDALQEYSFARDPTGYFR